MANRRETHRMCWEMSGEGYRRWKWGLASFGVLNSSLSEVRALHLPCRHNDFKLIFSPLQRLLDPQTTFPTLRNISSTPYTSWIRLHGRLKIRPTCPPPHPSYLRPTISRQRRLFSVPH
ncbi:hypothetical protein SCHPADRAFT_747719 [Schizopora paradoxa]|uniref:Uncharacterized protein n=1 Tax=Schizopora paradoxa TaxID=27342 RepID=A0A0H2QZ72_9AGAM|nr:hypothetical protein SCHPADRAFT_747719 [Schizopora paradoxa]